MIRAGLVWLILALPLAAQDLPDWQHTSINDFAHLLIDEDTRRLDQALIRLFDETDIEGTVVTLQSRAAYGGSDGLEAFATRLFNHWGVGDDKRNDGFMVLVLRDDREARIELGAGYPAGADNTAREIMRDIMLPAYRKGEMSGGIRDGTLAVIDRIARPAASGTPAPRPARRISDWLPQVIAIGFFGFIMVGLGRHIFRRIQHARRPCPRCGGRGLIEEVKPITAETEDGREIARQSVWTRCPRCGWHQHETRDAPQRRTARGSRGGFGGGRSSGGGASGRW